MSKKLEGIKKINNMGLDWVHESLAYIAQALYAVELCEKKLGAYEQKDWYQSRSLRQSIVLKRNEKINLALKEMRRWNKVAGITLFVVPVDCRSWEENVEGQKSAVGTFLALGKNILEYCQEKEKMAL